MPSVTCRLRCAACHGAAAARLWQGTSRAQSVPRRPAGAARQVVVQAYQDASGSPWPSSPWPRQQPAQQSATVPAGANGSTPAASAASSSGGGGGGSSSGGDAAAAQQQQGQQRGASRPHQRVRAYRGLSASQFQHPLDQQNTALLRALPGLELLARNMMGPVAEQVLLLENIGTAVLAGPDQLPSLHRLLVEAAAILEMEPPELYVRQNPVPNAYTLAIAGRKPFIVVHTALLELLTPAEVQAVLAHELGHLKCDHGVWLTAANVLAMGTVSLLPVVSSAVEEGLLRWLRAAELTCDRAALLVAQDSRVVVSVLMKLAGGSASLAGELSVDAFLRQARSYDEATASPVGWYLRNAQTRALSHPLPVLRAREIDRWSQSQQYQALVAANLPRSHGGGSAVTSSVAGSGSASSHTN